MNLEQYVALQDILSEVFGERQRQNKKWGGPDDYHSESEWWFVLERRVDDLNFRNIAALRTELIQVAAVAVAWVEAIDRREQANED